MKVLAQGNNQLICTQYGLKFYRTKDEVIENIKNS